MKFCTNCGTQLGDAVKFCTSCGTPLAAPQQTPQQSVLPQARPMASALGGMSGVEKYKPREPMTIEALESLMRERWRSPLPVEFRLVKDVFMKYIEFEEYMKTTPRLEIMKKTGEIVFTQNFSSSRSAAANYVGERKRRLMEVDGGVRAAGIQDGHAYFLALCQAMREMLGGQ